MLLRFPEFKSQSGFQKCLSLTLSSPCFSSPVVRASEYLARVKILGFFYFSFALWDRSKMAELLVDLLTKDKESSTFRDKGELILVK